MKTKFLPIIFSLAMALTLVGCDQTSVPTSGAGGESDPNASYPTYDEPSIAFHYQREDEAYSDWALWLWATGADGAEYTFNGSDSYGAVASYALSNFGSSVVSDGLGFIVKTLGSWSAKDTDADRFVEFDKFTPDANGAYHVYLKQGDANIYADPSLKIVDSIDVAQFSSYTQVRVETSNNFTSYKLYENDTQIGEGTVAATTSSTITLPGNREASFENSYKIDVTFEESGETLTAPIQVTSLYKTDEFEEEYNYDGELGAIYSAGSTTFKVWSPVSSDIKLRIYDNGTPASALPGRGDDTHQSYDMTRGEHGVWEATVTGDLAGKYYTFVVTNSSYSEKEVVDPYAYSAGYNGLRGMIVDFDETDPEGWDQIEAHPYDRKELTVYETHVSDISSSSTWGGTAANSKKFKGAYEAGTTYSRNGTSVTTGFDHIKELGVNAVQLVPIFDQAANDELNMEFNWGYNPLNYNVLEGGYSSDPLNGYVRIREFKELVMAYNQAGINIIMDVVYNHVNGAAGSQFDVLMPGYYFRYTADGTLSNGSGCGNETASEMYMFSKFMQDSTEFWAEEYKLGGFRFDLMGLHDLETMRDLVANLKTEVNPNIVVYGEPWTAGTSTLPTTDQAIQANGRVYSQHGYGAFNDVGRDAMIKGGLSAATDRGWVTTYTSQASSTDAGNGRLMIMGMTNASIVSPDATNNYVTCHDNYTLYDRIKAAGITDEATVKKMAMLANSVVLTSQGTSFILAGEEFLRTKGGNSNSYNATYEVNELDYSLKIANADMFENYKKLISFKQDIDGMHLGASQNRSMTVNYDNSSEAGEDKNAYSFFEYDINDTANGKTYHIIHTNGYRNGDIVRDLSGYELYLSTVDANKTLSASTTIQPYETIIAVKNAA